MNLLKQEVQKSAAYNSIIEAIASGKTGNNEIATTVGLTAGELTYYLKELQRIGLVEKEFPVCGGGRRSTYRLADNLFRFWYRFIAPNRSTIERHMPRRALALIQKHLSEYMGDVFERICREWPWRQNVAGKLGEDVDAIGRWWGNNPRERREEEIDIVGLTEDVPTVLGECKWQQEKVGLDVAKALGDRGGLIHASSHAQRFIFSKTGFTEGLREEAERDERLHLLSIEEMAKSEPCE